MQDNQNPTNPQIGNTNIASSGPGLPVNQDVQETNEQNPPEATGLDGNFQQETPINNFDNTNQFGQEEVVTSPHAPKKYGGTKVIATIFSVLVLIGGVTAGVVLVQRQQQIEERAASGAECQQAEDCILIEEPGNSGSFSAPEEVTKINITAKDVLTYSPGVTEDGCYKVEIEGRNVSWQRYGTEANCKDVSNIQVKFQVKTGQTEFIKICHYTSDPSEHPWQAIEVSTQGWELGHDEAHDYKKSEFDFPYTNSDPNCAWPDPGNFGITCADIWCEGNITEITPTETEDPDVTAKCFDVKTYDNSWNALTNEELTNLSAGTKLKFAVYGEASSGTFDRARFSVNNLSLGETTLIKPGSQEFYIEYTIPEDVTGFTVSAQIHHTELGWF